MMGRLLALVAALTGEFHRLTRSTLRHLHGRVKPADARDANKLSSSETLFKFKLAFLFTPSD